MKFSLDTIIINPSSEKKPLNAIILLHGYGGDGRDISLIAHNWKRFLPDTIFLSPNAPEVCQVNSSGYEWFDLSIGDEKVIYEKSLVAEKIIKKYINEIRSFYNLKNSNISLVGFSQGCMISLSIGLTIKEEINSIVGFSGKIINKEVLSTRMESKPSIFLLHGDMDTIVSPNYLLESKEFFLKIDYKIKTKLLKNCEHSIPVEASSLALDFLKKNLYK